MFFLFFIYTGDITTLPAMSLQDQNHWVLLRGAGRCGDHEGWVTLSVHLYINRYINSYQYTTSVNVLIWDSEELLVRPYRFLFTKSHDIMLKIFPSFKFYHRLKESGFFLKEMYLTLIWINSDYFLLLLKVMLGRIWDRVEISLKTV